MLCEQSVRPCDCFLVYTHVMTDHQPGGGVHSHNHFLVFSDSLQLRYCLLLPLKLCVTVARVLRRNHVHCCSEAFFWVAGQRTKRAGCTMSALSHSASWFPSKKANKTLFERFAFDFTKAKVQFELECWPQQLGLPFVNVIKWFLICSGELESLLPKKIRKRSSVQESCPKNQAPFTFSPPSQNPFRSHCSNEKVFSWNDVRLIVSNAVSIKEQQIREEYNRILNEKLEEQLRIYFEKYNEELLAARNRNNRQVCPPVSLS